VGTIFWKSLAEYERDLKSASADRVLEMRDWAAAGEAAADRPGLGRNPKARRMFRQMRVAAEARLAGE